MSGALRQIQRKPTKGFVPFAWKVIGRSDGALVTLVKCVGREEAEEKLATVIAYGYSDLQVVPVGRARPMFVPAEFPIILRADVHRSRVKVKRLVRKGRLKAEAEQDAKLESLVERLTDDGFDFYHFEYREDGEELVTLIEAVLQEFFLDNGATIEQVENFIHMLVTKGMLMVMVEQGELEVRRKNGITSYRRIVPGKQGE